MTLVFNEVPVEPPSTSVDSSSAAPQAQHAASLASFDAGPPAGETASNGTSVVRVGAQRFRRLRHLRRGGSSVGWAILGFVGFGLLWQLASLASPDVPTPMETLGELGTLLQDPFRDAGPNDKGVAILLMKSLGRVLAGFVIAVIVGVPLGLAAGSSPRVWKSTNPLIQLLRPVSPLAWFPIVLVAFKDSSMAAIWVIFITSIWPIALNTAAGAASVPNDQRNVAKVFRLNRLAYVRHVLAPHTLPNVITGMRLSMGTGWMVIVAVEMLSSQVGIGGYTWETYNALNLPRVAAIILIIGVVGLILDFGFLRLNRAITHQEHTS